MPIVFDGQVAHAFSKQTAKFATRDADDGGGLQENTKIGIAIGLICFFTLLGSFWYITHRHRQKKLATPTEDSEFRAETFSRWTENMSRLTNASTSRLHAGPEQAGRGSISTFATYQSHGEFNKQDGYELSRPPQARLATRQ